MISKPEPTKEEQLAKSVAIADALMAIFGFKRVKKEKTDGA